MDLVEFLRARLNDDEREANRVEPNQAPRDLRAMVTREGSPPFLVIDSARVLAEVDAKRRILDAYERHLAARERHAVEVERLREDIDREERGEPVVGHVDVRIRASRREADYLDAIEPVLRGLVVAAAQVYAGHSDYDEAWRP